MKRTRATAVSVLVSLLLMVLPGRAAAPVLIAIGTISGMFEDFATDTAAPLENSVPGNRLGGMGSGLAYMGGHFFLALPDRGPNAVSFNSCTDDTVSYINRFHTLHMTLAPSDPGSSLPFTLTPMVIGTTLLSSPSRLVYGAGCGSVGDGEPARNALDHTHYFTGRSDGFDSSRLSTDPHDARFDTESIRVSNDWRHVYISDEYGPYVYQFDRATGRRERAFTLPDMFAVSTLSSVGNDEIAMNASGRVANKGMEALAITPNGRTLVGAMQSPLLQDGGTVSGQTIRLVRIDLTNGKIQQFAYKLDTLKTTVSDIVAVNGHEFLVDERDSKGLADDSQAVIKRIYKIDLSGAQEVSTTVGAANLAAKAVSKQLFLDVVGVLTGAGVSPFDIPAKLEGLAFGQDVILGGKVVHTLYLANDNDYTAVVQNTHGTTTSNPNRFFVFAFSDTDLPTFVPQQFKKDVDDDDFGGWPWPGRGWPFGPTGGRPDDR